MDDNDMSDLVNSVKNMINNGNIPDNVKDILQNFSNTTNNSDSTSSNTEDFNSVNNSNSSSDEDGSFASSIDVGTILKMKSIIDSMNKKDDPRANLLYSLKPYLRDSRRGKLDQYVNLLNMTKIADVLKKEGGL